MSEPIEINLSPNRQCSRCQYNARSQFLVCALHPTGPEERECPDFKALSLSSQDSSQDELLDGQLPPPSNPFEEEWMRFWGPTEEEMLAFWGRRI
ncbi:hypothetical protein C7271_20580 [filamentous cyanobacterium CCP5]|nr:hypothetical protein C7271_20580 [filamentous cyanobacterium CCP5]